MPRKKVYPSKYTGKLITQDPNDLRYSSLKHDKCRTVNDFVDWSSLCSEVVVKRYEPAVVQKYLEGEIQLT